MRRTYLDYNATCPIRPQAMDAVMAVMRETGNASSIHHAGRQARKSVEDARNAVAALTGVRPAQVIFNSGATEGNNQILSGYRDKAVLVSSVEHPSVLEAAPHAARIPVTKEGLVDMAAYTALLSRERPSLVAVQLVNSETGVVQDVMALAALAKDHGALFLCDAVQAAGRIPLDFTSLGVDYLTLSGHKFGSPQGVGALVFREGLQIPKFLHGGGQEKRQRAGTENVAAIAGMGAAATLALQELGDYHQKCLSLRESLENGLRQIAPEIVVAAETAPRVPNTVNVILPSASAETQMMAMDLSGVCVSSGSACSSGTFKPSHVLEAMGYAENAARALRFSFGWATTDADIDAALEAYAKMSARLKA